MDGKLLRLLGSPEYVKDFNATVNRMQKFIVQKHLTIGLNFPGPTTKSVAALAAELDPDGESNMDATKQLVHVALCFALIDKGVYNPAMKEKLKIHFLRDPKMHLM